MLVALQVPGLGHLDFADHARLQQLPGPGRYFTGAHLGAVLHDAAVFFGGIGKHSSLPEHVAGRFLHVEILARPQCPDRNGCMPVVRSGNHDGIDGGVIQQMAKIAHHPGLAPGGLLNGFGGALSKLRVHVADRQADRIGS